MLSRATLPLLRLRTVPPAARLALPQTQLRAYARSSNDRSKRNNDYKLPDQSPSSDSATHSKYAKQPLRPIRQNPAEDLTAEPQFEPVVDSTESVERPVRTRKSAFDKTPFSQRAKENDARLQQDQPVDAADKSEIPDAEPTEPLPDLTQGIPSTLEAELSRAQAKRASANNPSLNITKDPSEPVAGEDEGRGPDDKIPRSRYVSSGDQKRNAAIRYTYLFLLLGGGGYAAYLGRNWESEEEERRHADAPSGWGASLFYNRILARLGSTMSYYNDPVTTKLLPDEETDPNFRMPFTLVLSLEDMLVHSEWTRATGWRIAKRPGLDYFLRYLSQYYELVLFTSQPSAMADPVLRKLDPYSTIRWPLYREATLYKDGGYIKDISYLNRDLKKVIMIDTDSHHVKNQPENAIVLPKWTGDPNDQTLVQFIPFLEYLANMGFDDARTVLKSFDGKYIPAEFARREKLLREKFDAQQKEKRGKPKKSLGLSSILTGKPRSADGLPTTEEAAAEGKMLWDIIRERGQQNYMEFEKKIREEGEKWLAEREAEEKRLQEEAMKSMRSGFFGGWFGGAKKE